MRPVELARKLAPHARPEYMAALENGDALFAKYGITTPIRLAHFFAQIMHESGALTIREESLNYTAQRMTQVWPSRFPTIASAEPFAHNPQALANKVYNGRMGNASGSNDGWNYRGRGLMQTTGREGYRRMGKLSGVDFEGHPDLVMSAEHALKPALAEWGAGNCNQMADHDDIRGITKFINGGYTGLAEREALLRRIKPVIHDVTLVPGAPAMPPVAQPRPPVRPPAKPPLLPTKVGTDTVAGAGAGAGAGAAGWLAYWLSSGNWIATVIVVVGVAIISWLIWKKIKGD